MDCTSRNICAWCSQENTCSPSPSLVSENGLSNVLPCASPQSKCSSGADVGCYSARSCGECTSWSGCLWCDKFRSCLPSNATGNLPCQWTVDSCPQEICDVKSSCHDCAQPSSTSNELCHWCTVSKVCASADSTCTPNIASAPSCEVPCPLVPTRCMATLLLFFSSFWC